MLFSAYREYGGTVYEITKPLPTGSFVSLDIGPESRPVAFRRGVFGPVDGEGAKDVTSPAPKTKRLLGPGMDYPTAITMGRSGF